MMILTIFALAATAAIPPARDPSPLDLLATKRPASCEQSLWDAYLTNVKTDLRARAEVGFDWAPTLPREGTAGVFPCFGRIVAARGRLKSWPKSLDPFRPELFRYAAKAVASAGDKKGLRALIAATRDPSTGVVRAAAEALATLKDPRANAALLEVAKRPELREIALLGIVAAGDPAALLPLRARRKQVTDSAEAQELDAAIHALESRAVGQQDRFTLIFRFTEAQAQGRTRLGISDDRSRELISAFYDASKPERVDFDTVRILGTPFAALPSLPPQERNAKAETIDGLDLRLLVGVTAGSLLDQRYLPESWMKAAAADRQRAYGNLARILAGIAHASKPDGCPGAMDCRRCPASPPCQDDQDFCTCSPDLDMGCCCLCHDCGYCAGKTEVDRLGVDRALRDCIAKRHQALAKVYFMAVRAFGWKFFRYADSSERERVSRLELIQAD